MKGHHAFIAAIIAWALMVAVCIACKADDRQSEQGAGAAEVTVTQKDDGRIPGDDVPARENAWASADWEEDENARIEQALIEKAHRIDGCLVTWYTEATCGKAPSHPAYGITASGMHVQEHLTVAVDRKVIPLYSDVFVQYADGTIEQLWATDTGVRGNHIDIYTPDYNAAMQNGVQFLTVWWIAPEK